MNWIKYNSINELPSGLWETKVARGDAALDKRLVRVVERIYTGYRFDYWLRDSAAGPSALVLCVNDGQTICTGTPETTGLHLWYDQQAGSRQQFLEEVRALYAGSRCPFVFRDFIGPECGIWKPALEQEGFLPQRALDLSILHIPDGIRNLEEYPSVLNAKHRYRWNRYRAALNPEHYAVETLIDYLPVLDALYPLYLEVVRRAEEYRAEPYPPEYFRIVKEEFGDDAVMVTIRGKSTGVYLGFMLVLYGVRSCVHQYIGFHRREELFLWHNLTIASIGDAIRRNVRRVNMGVTHALAKRKFGAQSQEVIFFIKE